MDTSSTEETTDDGPSLATLHEDVLGPIIGRLDLPDRLSVALVCHRLREVEKRTPRLAAIPTHYQNLAIRQQIVTSELSGRRTRSTMRQSTKVFHCDVDSLHSAHTLSLVSLTGQIVCRMEKAEPEIRSLVTNAPISDLPNGYYSFQIRWCEVNLLDWEFRRTATCLHHGNNRCHDFCRLRSATGQHIVPFASRDVGDVCLQSRSVDDAVPTALLTRVLPRSICANIDLNSPEGATIMKNLIEIGGRSIFVQHHRMISEFDREYGQTTYEQPATLPSPSFSPSNSMPFFPGASALFLKHIKMNDYSRFYQRVRDSSLTEVQLAFDDLESSSRECLQFAATVMGVHLKNLNYTRLSNRETVAFQVYKRILIGRDSPAEFSMQDGPWHVAIETRNFGWRDLRQVAVISIATPSKEGWQRLPYRK